MGRRCQPSPLDDPSDLQPQERDRVWVAAVGKRGKQSQEKANADHFSTRRKAAQANCIHVRGAMDRGPAVRFCNDEEFTPAHKILYIGRQRRQIAQSAKDWVSFVTQNPEWPAGRCGHFVKDVFAVTEKREIVVVEPPQKVPDLGKFSRRHWGGRGL